jgi:tRNA pseudouridine38-40 synthase
VTRYRATLAYDGTRFHGFQRQTNTSPTVQDEVEAALKAVGGQHVGVLAAGRTDAGVHASGQVIAFDLDWRHPTLDLRNALNANLPDDVAVCAVEATNPDFHPRFDARSRTYQYALYVSDVRNPQRRFNAWHLTGTLDAVAVQQTAASLVGSQDFATFGTPPEGHVTVRDVLEARWEANDSGSEHRFTIMANAFLFRMVRSIVGTLVMVGQGRMTVDGFRAILAARDRQQSGPAAPPQGLTLIAVNYDD